MSAIASSLKRHFAADHFIRGGAADDCFTCEEAFALRANTRGFGEILADAFDKTFN